MKIFGKALKEYLWPIRYYILIAVVVVVFQYYFYLPLQDQYPFLGNLTQALWALMVALSVLKLVREYNFNMKQVLFLGVLYCLIIHGLKAFFFRVFLFPYEVPAEQALFRIMDRFLYGSFLVMVIVLILGPIFIYLREKNIY
jgi:hypothetical protein